MGNRLDGLIGVNIELSSICNKNCFCCGRRKFDKDFSEIKNNYGYMDFDLVKKISQQLPNNIIVAFHNNGEGLMYPEFGKAIKLFENQIKCIDTNGKLLLEKYPEIVNNLDTITISTLEEDDEWEEQYEILKEFLKRKGNKKPNVIIRCTGNFRQERMNLYEDLNCIIANRILHSPMGSFNYTKKTTIPEIGVCLEAISRLAIDRFGNVSMCVRFDPEQVHVLGNLNEKSLSDIWHSEKRLEWLNYHIKGKRNMIPLCSKCDYWGIPRGE